MRSRLFWLTCAGLLVVMLAACGGHSVVTPPPSGFTHLSAQAVDNDGNPLAGASVRVDGKDTGVTTDANGNFTVPASAFPRGGKAAHEMSFGKDGVVLGAEDVVPEDNADGTISFGQGDGTATVTGTIYDEVTGDPIDQAEVLLFSIDLGVFLTQSNQGVYSVENVAAGDWQVAAFKLGYNPQMASVSVADGATVTQDLALSPIGSITPGDGLKVKGVLRDSKTNAPIGGAHLELMADTGYCGMPETSVYNDVKGGFDETPSGGAVGAADSSDPGCMPYRYDPQYQETTSNADGTFEFDNDVVGYSIWMNYSADGYLPGSHYEDINGKTGELDLELTLDPLVLTSISGKVVDEHGDAVEGAYVEFIFGAGGGPILANMDVPAGMDLQDMAANGGEVRSDTGSPPPPAAMGMPGADGTAGWAEWESANSGGGPAPDSNSGADNSLMQRYRYEHQKGSRSASDDAPYFNGYYSATTGADGTFEFTDVPAGQYYVFASAYKHLTYNGEFEAKEDPAENYVEIELPEVPVGAVEGTVTDDEGNPIEDALVNCTQPYVDPFTYTDAAGHYRIENVPTGDWIVGAYKTGFLTVSKDATVTENQTVAVDLVLTKYEAPPMDTITITGRLSDGADNTGIESADLVFTPVDDTLGGEYHRHVVTGTNGEYSTTLIPNTEYNLLVQKTGYMDLYTRIYVDSEYPQLDLMLWKIGSNGGGWGGTVRPPMPPDGGPGNTEPGGGGGTDPGEPQPL